MHNRKAAPGMSGQKASVGELEVGLLLIHLTLVIAALSRRRP